MLALARRFGAQLEYQIRLAPLEEERFEKELILHPSGGRADRLPLGRKSMPPPKDILLEAKEDIAKR